MAQEVKKLHRSRTDKMIFGVCGGLAKHFDIDPVFVRLITVLLCFVNGIGIIGYLILAIITPEEPVQDASNDNPAKESVVDAEFVDKSETPEQKA